MLSLERPAVTRQAREDRNRGKGGIEATEDYYLGRASATDTSTPPVHRYKRAQDTGKDFFEKGIVRSVPVFRGIGRRRAVVGLIDEWSNWCWDFSTQSSRCSSSSSSSSSKASEAHRDHQHSSNGFGGRTKELTHTSA